VAEALLLLLVGAAYLGWLVIDRRPTMDLIKQVLIAVAFILWGVNNLMLTGRWAAFVGAVVIAIYVFDLAWLMEGNLRKTFGIRSVRGADEDATADRRPAGGCGCDGTCGAAGVGSTGEVHAKAQLRQRSKTLN